MLLPRAIVLCTCVSVCCYAHEQYVARNPNGGSVPGVAAIGHKNPQGGGAENAYGHAFKSAGLAWTESLCAADSDGDGQSNGFELGDECCLWTTAKLCNATLATLSLSNPGDASSTSNRAACNCSADAALPCACCGAPRCASGGSGGGGGDDDDDGDDDDNHMLWYAIGGGGMALIITAAIAVVCVRRRCAAAAATSRGATDNSMLEEQPSYYAMPSPVGDKSDSKGSVQW